MGAGNLTARVVIQDPTLVTDAIGLGRQGLDEVNTKVLQPILHGDYETAFVNVGGFIGQAGAEVTMVVVPGLGATKILTATEAAGRLALEADSVLAGTGRLVSGARPVVAAQGGAELETVGVAAKGKPDFILGDASEIRRINVRPNAADPNWGLTPAHLEKHLFGDGKYALNRIDPAGTSDQWMHNLTDLYNSPVTGTTKNGMLDIIKTFPKANGNGTYKMGIRITPAKPDGSHDLITILTGQGWSIDLYVRAAASAGWTGPLMQTCEYCR